MIDLRNHYGFTRTPFGKDLAPSMLCHYPAHAEAVARITWCARERALGVVTGEVGSGKTASARAAVAALDQTRHTLIYLADPTTGTRGIHYQVVTALGGRPAHGSATLAAQAAALLAAEHNERGRVPVLAIDEAHLLTHHQLEAVRILTNAEMDAASPLACLLLGQPTLRRMLRLGVLAALDQRIAIRYAMPAMTAEQTGPYITHHLKLAGRSDPLFSDDAVTLIHDAARGLPRAVNNLATQALVAAMTGRKNIVDEHSARAAVTEVTTDRPIRQNRRQEIESLTSAHRLS
jgi:type II secretory pathway predicted ATPase ExeA